jgi:hypothetical protein
MGKTARMRGEKGKRMMGRKWGNIGREDQRASTNVFSLCGPNITG